MKKSRKVSPEEVESLGLIFPGVHKNELTNFLKENDFDDAVDLLNQLYPPEQNSSDQEYDYDYKSDDDNIEALSNSIPLDDKKDMIKEIREEFPDFDDDVCIIFLEDSQFDVNEAKKKAHATKQLMQHYIQTANSKQNLIKLQKDFPNLSEICLTNALEASSGDYGLACSILRDSIEPTKTEKKPKKKQVLFENGPISYMPKQKKQKKFKNKPNILSMKSTEKTLACEFSNVNDKMKSEALIVQLSEMFEGKDKDLTREDYEEALKLTNYNIDRAATIITQKIESFELNESASHKDSNVQKSKKSEKMKQLVQLFPQTLSTELEDVLYISYGNLNVASELMLNRLNGSPIPEEELRDRLLKEVPRDETKNDVDFNDDDDDEPIIVVTKTHSVPSKISAYKTNRNQPRPSMHGKTDQISVDLHGLNVTDAQVTVMKTLDASQHNNVGLIEFITGRGTHTKGHVSVLRPLVLTICKERGFRAHVGSNRGVVVCHIV